MRSAVEQAWLTIDEYLTATRYAVRDPQTGQPLEKNFEEMLTGRILPKLKSLTSPIACPERLEELAQALRNRRLIAATPFLMSFGNPHTRRPGFFSCYPLGWVEDSLDDIEAMRHKMRTIYMSGGGAGIDLSHLRAKGAPVDAGQGIASGPVGFLPDFDAVTGTTNQGGRRRGALLVQLDWNHPDIRDFVEAKNFNAKLNRFIQSLPAEERPAQGTNLSNMNISVNAFGDFWRDRDLVGHIASNMWATGDPGLLFVDNMLQYSPLRAEDEPRFSNPCGEYLASAGSACNLITVNAARLARETFDQLMAEGELEWSEAPAWSDEFCRRFWAELAKAAGQACFLGNLVLEFDEGYPLPEIREKTQALKPVGVGMSGFHTALLLAFRGRVDYGSPEAQNFARATQAYLTLGTLNHSAEMADLTGHVYENRPFWTEHLRELSDTLAKAPGSEEHLTQIDILSDWVETRGGFYNCLTTSQAPTGSVSVFLRNIDTGIEPFFALAQNRRVRDAAKGWVEFVLRPMELADLFEKYPDFHQRAEAQTALKLSPQEQLGMLAAFQYHCHTGVSKTINLPKEATVEDIECLIAESREKRLKGFTVYRDSSLDGIITAADQPAASAVTEAQPQPYHNPVPDIGADRESRTFTAESHNLTAHITLTHDERKNIREVFVSAGDVGASINSIFTALGMIISVALREVPSLFDRFVKVLCKVSMGERYIVRTRMSDSPIVGGSLPQVIGRLMMLRKEFLQKGSQLVEMPAERGGYDLCPDCHELSLRREGSCRKCDRCGYSSC